MSDPIKVTWPPMLYTDTRGQKWAISGQHWVKVPDDMTLDRVGEYMVVDDRFTPSQLAEVLTYDVVGSKGDTYAVTNDRGNWTCTCAGFGFRRKCRHITEIKDGSR